MTPEQNVQLRDLMITVAFTILRIVQISDLTSAEYNEFLRAVNDK